MERCCCLPALFVDVAAPGVRAGRVRGCAAGLPNNDAALSTTLLSRAKMQRLPQRKQHTVTIHQRQLARRSTHA